MCGVATTSGRAASDQSRGGSVSNTSRPAPATMPAVDGPAERGFVDELAARRVHEAHARLARREPGIVEQVVCFRRGRQVEREHVGGAAHVIERQQLDAQIRRHLGRNEWIVGDDAHAEGAGAPGHFPSDAPEADQTERFAAQLRAEKSALFPPAVLHRPIRGRHRACKGQHQRPRVLGDADAVGAGRVDDEDAAGAGGGHVDVVDAGAGTRHDSKTSRGGEQSRVDFRGAADEQGIGIGQIGGELVRRPARARIDGPSGFGGEQRDGRWRQVVSDDDLQWSLRGVGPIDRVRVATV